MRALWTAASGLSSQQTKIDAISNNIANLNTVGYQSKEVSFSDLLQSEYKQADAVNLPTRQGAQDLRLGNGAYAAYLQEILQKGSLQQTGNPLDLASTGQGLFSVQKPDGLGGSEVVYTRAGQFSLDKEGSLVNDQGYKVLDQDNLPIQIPPEYQQAHLSVAKDGSLTAELDGQSNYIATINLTMFHTPGSSLQAVGSNVYKNVNTQNDPGTRLFYEVDPAIIQQIGGVQQGMLEQSNVDLPKEMTDLIETQRIFQLNSRAIQTVDQMMGMANDLRS